MPQTSLPVVVMISGGKPVVNIGATPTAGAFPATVVTALGLGITIVSANGVPMTLRKPDGSAYP